MISIDSSIALQILAFLAFWFFFNRLLIKPYLEVVEERERRTDGARAEASQLAREAEELKAEYEKAIADAAAEAQAIKETIRAEGARIRDETLQRARAEAAGRLQAARATIQRELEAARRQAARDAEELAADMAAKILGRRVA
ncbi:MAG TPA: ATP synthase F0 subunit B [Candidatus Acidoferrales bacterium]|nr:ATP synthase F0 subunit B [Candidatus Acidoferrales bacterium]